MHAPAHKAQKFQLLYSKIMQFVTQCCGLSQGFQDVRNVTGGIDAYSREVDSSVPLY